jgi:aspartyl-tRNA(Asn)/glutamyl-tRNA(Gln) amidotransferase subunit A
MKLEETSAAELGRRIAARELTSRSVVETFLQRIERLDGQLGSFVLVDPEAALAEADRVDRRLASGDAGLSPLAGVPFSLKDNICVAGVATTCGSRMLVDFRPPYDATVVERLRSAGLVLLGKTNLDEFAMGASTETSIFGAAKNPWDRQRTAGGSSGGAAASVAAGLTPLAIGSDTGGSVRQPAAFCGVLGLKPTYGRVSRYGLVAFASSLDQIGPLAHSAEDLALLMEVIAGHDRRDSTSLPVASEEYASGLAAPLKGVRIGLLAAQLASDGLSDDIRSAVQRAADALRSLGASIVDVELPHAAYSVATYYLIAPSEASSNLARYDGARYGFREQLAAGDASLESMYCRSRSAGFGAEVQRRIMLGTFALSSGYYDAYYRKALELRRLIYEDYRRAFESVDLILGPVTPSPAFRIGEKLDDPVQMYLEDLFTVGANLAGIPAISIPAGANAAGLPLACQLQGKPLSESRLLSAAHQLQHAGFFSPRIAPLS